MGIKFYDSNGKYWGEYDETRSLFIPSEEALADRKTEPQKKEVEWVYNKRERLWYPYSNGELLFKDKPTTQTETQNSNLTFEKVMEEIQTQVIEFPDTHQKFIFTRKIEMDGDSIKICGWEYKGVKDGEREGE